MDPELRTLVWTTWGILSVAAGVGLVVLAVQQMLQDLLALRYLYQRRDIPAIVRSIADGLRKTIKIRDKKTGDTYEFEGIVRADSDSARLEGTRDVAPERALDNLVRLATAGKADALYGLPIDQLAGQLSVAAQSVLDFPRNNPDLVLILSSGAEVSDLIRILSPPPAARDRMPAERSSPSQEEIDFLDARNRVAHQVQRNLDALQIHMSYWLQHYFQLWAIGFGLAFAFLLFWFSTGNPFLNWTLFRQWVVIGTLAGFFSTLFSNTLTALLGRRGAR
jgi:hypothetical protein